VEINYKASRTLANFHKSDAFVRGVRGCLGSGKSVAMCMEIVHRACRQAPFENVRKTRWGVVRNTYGELKTTTVRTWQDWFPDEIAPITWDAPIVSKMLFDIADGTTVDLEVLFMSLDRPQDVKKLKSLELTGLWINEASELPKAILDMATGRVGRYPAKREGGSTWSGIIMDTNSPDDDHWFYDLAELNPLEGYQFFSQPGALLRTDDGKYIPNPEAENIENQSLGYDYWLRQIPGKTDEWIKVFVLGQYGSVHDGKPVYPEYNDGIHCKPIAPIQGVKLNIGLDFGLTPAAVITQVDSRGRLLVLDELCGDDIGIRGFLEDALIPHLIQVYPAWFNKKDTMIQLIGDPAGEQRAQTDERSCFEEVRFKGLKIKPAKTNAWLPRRGAVAWYMSKLSGGQPAFLIDPCCSVTRKGLNGGYKYRRIQVTGEERYTDVPSKNNYSHPHDALQYAAMETGGIQAIKAKEAPMQRLRAWQPADASMGALG